MTLTATRDNVAFFTFKLFKLLCTWARTCRQTSNMQLGTTNPGTANRIDAETTS